MKVVEHIDKAKNPLFSFEIVPPPRGRSVKEIVSMVETLEPFDPPWIDVTAHSAGAFYNEKNDGSVERRIYKKRPGTIGICGIIQNRFKIDTVTHLLCNGFTQEETEDALIELQYLGIHNILALRGDGLNYSKKVAANRRVNRYAIDLVEQVGRMKKGDFLNELSGAEPLDFCVGIAGYPEKHFEAPNIKFDIQWLKKKVDAGAEYITTQMFFNNDHYWEFVKLCRSEGIMVPIIPGLKILKSVKQLQNIPRHFYINFPDELVDQVMAEPERVKEIGTEWTKKQTEDLVNNGAPCVHYYVMNDTAQVAEVVKSFR
jgi:methylenetetrahydrofolate reductase (NADPH)